MPVATRRFTRAEYYRMAEAGVLQPDERVELVEGAIVRMSPQNAEHARCISILTDLLPQQLEAEASHYARFQLPLVLSDDTELEPDAALVRGTWRDYEHHPRAGVALLVIEVADSSLAYDRTTKQRLYAAHGIPHYWVVNLPDGEVEVYSEPRPSGYAEQALYQPGDALSIPEHPDAHIRTLISGRSYPDAHIEVTVFFG